MRYRAQSCHIIVASAILFPMPLPARDAQLVHIVDATLADAARRAGDFLACRIGCTQCCHGAFAINALDAARLREGIVTLRATNPALAAEIALRARVWLAKYGSDFPGDSETGILGTSEVDQASFEDFANDAACPALDPSTGRCDVYAWRPMTCRVFGPPVRSVSDSGAEGLGHCDLCFALSAPALSKSLPARCLSHMISKRSCLKKSVRKTKPSSRLRCCLEGRNS
jgi:Fe-S-cluster containining protein